MESVIPTLVQCEGNNQDVLMRKVSEVTQVFIDALPDLPEHRRLSLFKQLASTLGVQDNLWIILMLITHSHVIKAPASTSSSRDDDDEDSKQKIPKNIGFLLTLNNEFSVIEQVQSVCYLVKYLKSLPLHKSFNENLKMVHDIDTTIIKWDRFSSKQLRHFLYLSVSVLNQLLSMEKFIDKMFEDKINDVEELKKIYQNLLEHTLCFLKSTTDLADKATEEFHIRFFGALQKKLLELLDRINSLLPPSMFIEVIANLMKSPIPLVRCRAIELLCSKLQPTSTFFEDEQLHSQLIPFISKFKEIAENPKESTENKQTTLFALQLLIRLLSDVIEPAQLIPLFTSIIEILDKNCEETKVISQCTLVAAETVICLKARSLPQLPKLFPALLRFVLPSQNEGDNSEELLVLSALTSLQKMLESIPKFLSSYLKDIINNLCMLSALQENSKFKESRIMLRIIAITETLVTNVQGRYLIPQLSKVYKDFTINNLQALPTFLNIIKVVIQKTPGNLLANFQLNTVQIFTEIYDIRSKYEKKNIEYIEDIVNDTLTELLIKLNEEENLKIFQNIKHWALEDDKNPDRLITFYKFCKHLSATYKILFIKAKFANVIFDNICTMLEKNNSLNNEDTVFGSGNKNEAKACELLNYIIDTLTNIFLYDTVNFTDMQKFNLLLKPLIKQLENKIGDDNDYECRIKEHISPCVVKFTIAIADDSLWKDLNRQLLLRVRNDDDPKVSKLLKSNFFD